MTDERYKAIMAELGQPHSHSLLAALRQVVNEVAQEVQAAERKRCKARAMQIVEWHRNDYNRQQIDPIVGLLQSGL